MTAVAISEPGGPEVLVAQDCAVPRPGENEILVRVAYAGVNRPDALQRAGAYPPPPGASLLPGLEMSGEVVAIGGAAPRELLGSQVCALTNGGAYAEYCAVDWRHCLPVPDGLPLVEAAALPETLFTVWHNVFQRGLARDGETMLVHGGTSGIGTMAIKLGKLFGMTVIVTCGSADKCAAAVALGADHAINYREQDFVEAVRGLTGGKGVELALDMVAGSYTQRNLDCIAQDGRLVTIATLGGREATINVGKMMVMRQTLTGSTLRPRSADFKAMLAQDIRENVWPAVAEGELRPAMDMVFPLREAAAAHKRMEAGEHIGKIVLNVAGEG
ncbi:zinc-binding dehydrogenase [Altererythrobacter salegens]|uniref:Zinc-binding dehydrogenase n=1 Tax=Croceibacterium salegens TaxID=1737568 RepID=A0A6I4T1L1_9SPHN|nr:NAD(P)H-quinone oxidoreductase [Croceibacterium salegens]MXO60532.1 zinc-binding dehydrogenase [Croceibacterium salegens]